MQTKWCVSLLFAIIGSLLSSLGATDLSRWIKRDVLAQWYFSAPAANILRCEKLCGRQKKCAATSFDIIERVCYMHAADEVAATTIEKRGRFMFTKVRRDTVKPEKECNDAEISLPSTGGVAEKCVDMNDKQLNSVTGTVTQKPALQMSPAVQTTEEIVPVCIHGGKWNSSMSACMHCDYGFTGTTCERRIMDCTEGTDLGYTGVAIMSIQPVHAKTAFEVECNFKHGRTVVEVRGRQFNCGSFTNFNRTWGEYKNGFGDVNCEYFVGLENLHMLTSQGNRRFMIRLFGATDYITNYWDFTIDNEVSSYTMHYSYYSPFSVNYPGGDGFGLGSPDASLNHSPFCTPDRDCGSCAQKSASGWWFNKVCPEINLHKPLETGISLEWPDITGTAAPKIQVHSIRLILAKGKSP